MSGFLARNLKVFFRDKTSVFFSLLSVLIILALYLLFLGDVWTSNMGGVPGARTLMDSWIMSGILAVASLTTTMGAFGTLVDDRVKKLTKDFYSSPISRGRLASGYILSSYLIGILMTLVALLLGQGYLLINGGALLTPLALVKVLGIVLLSTLTNTALVLFLVSFLKSQNAFATASTIIGTLIGFLTGIYLPVGMLPQAIQYIIKVFPVSHAALLLRQSVMQAPMAVSFAGAPAEQVQAFEELMGVSFRLGGQAVTPLVSIAILAGTAVLFYLLSIGRLAGKDA